MSSFVNGLLVGPLYEGGDDVWQVHSRRTDVLHHRRGTARRRDAGGDPGCRLAPRLVRPGASRHESGSDSGPARGVRPARREGRDATEATAQPSALSGIIVSVAGNTDDDQGEDRRPIRHGAGEGARVQCGQERIGRDDVSAIQDSRGVRREVAAAPLPWPADLFKNSHHARAIVSGGVPVLIPLLLALWVSPTSATPIRDVPVDRALFRFRVGFSNNLHHFLYVLGRARNNAPDARR